MKIVLRFSALAVFLLPTLSWSQCSTGCTSTNPAVLPASIDAGMVICITTDMTYNGSTNLNGGVIRICNGATVRFNGTVRINSATSALQVTGCSTADIHGSIFNNLNPLGLLVMDGCNCATAIDPTGVIHGFGVVCDVGPLPVELISFETACTGNQVRLDWITASEQNNDHFLLEQSKDGVEWTKLAEVRGAGNSNVLQSYTYTVPAQGSMYYRLSQVDTDGEITVYDPRYTECSGSEEQVMVYPNPTSGDVNIRLSGWESGQTSWSLVALSGTTVAAGNLAVKETAGQWSLPLTGIAPGTYLLRIQAADGEIRHERLVIQ